MIDLLKLSLKKLNELLEENEEYPIRCKIINKVINERKSEEKRKEKDVEMTKLAKIERKKRKKHKQRLRIIKENNKESINKILNELDDLDLDFLGDVIDQEVVIDDQDAEKFHKKDNLNDNMMNRLNNEIVIRKDFNQTRQFGGSFGGSLGGSLGDNTNISGFRR